MLNMGKISPIRAPILSSVYTYYREKLIKQPDSVRVENMPNNCSVFQNTVELHLAQCPPKALEPRLFSPLRIPHINPLNPARTPI
jgi:hypothetical protein